MRRHAFLTAAGTLFAAPALAKSEATPKPHQHGLNGAQLPLNRPIEMHMRVLDGPDFDLIAHRGSVVVLNFFATWCAPCREEAADIVTFARAHAGAVVVVSVDYRETDDRVRDWRKKYTIDYPLAMDEHGYFAHDMGLKGFPTTIFFRPDGTVSCVHVGSLSAQELDDEYRLALGPDPAATVASPAPGPAGATPSPAPSSN